MNIYDLMPRLRFAAQLHYEMHYNQKNVKVTDCRIFYVTEGHGQLQIDGNRYELQPGCLFYCCAGSIYKISTLEGFSFISLNFDLSSHSDRSGRPFPRRLNRQNGAPWRCLRTVCRTAAF